jgi:2-dehydropantoate 2-reductase
VRFAVFGAGGVGGYFGARLAAAGHHVTFIARGEHLAAIRAGGLRLESIKGDLHLDPATATDRPADVGAVDWVLCAVKTVQLDEALTAMGPVLGERTAVLALQNGLDAADRIAAALGSSRVVAAAVWIRSEIAAPGVIRHAGVEPRIAFGELDGSLSPRVIALQQAFAAAGVRAEASARIRSVQWSKFLFIAASAAVGAVTRATIGECRSLAPTRALLIGAIDEAFAVANRHGAELPADTPAEIVRFLDALPAGTTTSMQRDIAAGRPSELDDLCGAVVRRGREVGVSTPINEFLYAALLPQEERARSSSSPGVARPRRRDPAH